MGNFNVRNHLIMNQSLCLLLERLCESVYFFDFFFSFFFFFFFFCCSSSEDDEELKSEDEEEGDGDIEGEDEEGMWAVFLKPVGEKGNGAGGQAE